MPIQVSDKEEIDFKYNLKVYFLFLKKYAWSSLFLILLVFFLQSLDLAFNYVFKLIVDNANQLLHGQITAETFNHFLKI
ncbi:MAG TPA: hypothetical protein VN963_01070, partial [bacterium]|nr:hypothetical protein [bacterium]